MKDHEYRQLISRPDVMSRRDLEATARELRVEFPVLAARIDDILGGIPVLKPSAHSGGPETDFLYLQLTDAEIEAIYDIICDLEGLWAPSDDSDNTDRTKLNEIAALVDRWYPAVNWS